MKNPLFPLTVSIGESPQSEALFGTDTSKEPVLTSPPSEARYPVGHVEELHLHHTLNASTLRGRTVNTIDGVGKHVNTSSVVGKHKNTSNGTDRYIHADSKHIITKNRVD